MAVADHSSFPIRPVPAVRLDARPRSYVADWCALAALIQNVTGDARRSAIEPALRGSARLRGTRLVPIPPRPLSARLLADRLTPAQRDRWVAGDPVTRISGEYLPPYLPGEVEIARLLLFTTPRVVLSVRASGGPTVGRTGRQRRATGAWAPRTLRVVDEHGRPYTVPAPPPARPMSLRELIRCIDGVRAAHLPEHAPDQPFPEALLQEVRALGVGAGEACDYVQVTSAVYPELRPFYRARLTWWVRQRWETGPRSRYARMTVADTLVGWWRGRGRGGRGAD